MSIRLLACVALTALAALLAPQAAGASTKQLSLIQDDSELFGDRGEDPGEAMKEIAGLGVDVLRTNVLFYRVYTGSLKATTKPSGINLSNPNDSHYNWAAVDRIVDLARGNGLQILATVSGPGPRWASDEPSRCTRGSLARIVPCTWKPNPKIYAQFVAAVTKRYGSRFDWYSLYNEPNLYTWITPEITKTRLGKIETAAIYYRKLWHEGYKAVSKYAPSRRSRVLFGEVAAIGLPLPLLRASLCLHPTTGKKLTGALRVAYKCPVRPAKLNIGGFAIHPYNFGAYGKPLSKTSNKQALTGPYLPRLTRLASQAARAGRIPGSRAIYMTEFGYQTKPPDRYGVSLSQQAQYINESDRLFWGSSRVKAVAQYELVDVPREDQFNSGLRFAGGARTQKPAYAAYRLPIVITKRSSSSVEVWGQVRPSGLIPGAGGVAQPEVQVDKGSGFQTFSRPFTNSQGYFRLNVSQPASAKFRLLWTDPRNLQVFTSRTAKAGKPLTFYKN
jgi:hypothetical protein